MNEFPQDIYTESDAADDTFANLGPLRALAGVWTSAEGLDVNPKAEGPQEDRYIERAEFQPIDAQANGPQVFYGLRYHVHIIRPGEVETFHDQVGYWLWEPATGHLIQTVSIPRGQTAMAVGQATPDARTFRLEAVRGSETNGIISNPFLEYAFKTLSYTITVTVHDDGTWSYEQDTVLQIPGQAEPFHHTDRNRLCKVAEPTPNPRALAAASGGADQPG
jgi:hypothetical protein